MNSKERIEAEDKKSLKKFRLIIIGGFIIGILIGVSSALIDDVSLPMDEIIESMKNVMIYVIPGFTALISIIIFAICIYRLRRMEQLYQDWDGVNAITTIILIVILFLYGAEFYFFNRTDSFVSSFVLLAAATIVFMASLFVGIMIQKKAINLTKLLNPEKRGSVYDLNFNKKWEDSSDEREMSARYRAGYQAYKATQITCMLFWVLFFSWKGLLKQVFSLC